MKRDKRDPEVMGEFLLGSLEQLRADGVEVTASEMADELEQLHKAGKIELPPYSELSEPGMVSEPSHPASRSEGATGLQVDV